MRKQIIFMGCRGYTRNYGGWETFVKNLIDNWKDSDTDFYVMELTHDPDEKKVEVINGVTCLRVYVKQTGQIAMMLMDLKTLFKLKSLVKQYRMDNPIVYVMGARVGISFWALKDQIKKAGITVVHNPAGLEWKRKKFNSLIRLHSRVAHFFFNRTIDYIVCDSMGILDVYKTMVKLDDSHMKYIAYGTYEATPLQKEMPQKVKDYFQEKKIEPNGYYLVLGRMVPENNYDLIVQQFMQSDTQKDLVLICNNKKENKYYNQLLSNTNCASDSRIKFVGTMYDREILNYIRQLATAYIHGHSVGGTNPGLLEAMSATDVNLLYNVVFNKQVGGDCALYFDEITPLFKLIKRCDKMTQEEKKSLGDKSKKRMKDLYSWDRIVSQYEDLFNEICAEARR